MADPPESAPATRHDEDVLRYWLATLRHEASMVGGCEPLGRLDGQRPAKIDLARPSSGGRYFELPIAPAGRVDEGLVAFLTRTRGGLVVPLSAATGPLFEHWLHGAYRREYQVSRGRRGTGEVPTHDYKAGFPVVLHRQRRRTLLAPLLELEVPDVAWLDDEGEAWTPPGYSQRKAGRLGEPPKTLRLRARRPEPEDATLPLRLNLGLLQGVLGLEERSLRELREAADSDDAAGAVAAVARWLSRGPDGNGPEREVDPAQPAQAIEALVEAAAAWFATKGATVRPGAMIFDAAWGVPTGRLQDELTELLRDVPGLAESGPLTAYLAPDRGHGREGATRAHHVGLQIPRPLTAPQRRALEDGLTEPLTAVQGPPGTGKTHMILQLAAHMLVDNAARGAFDPASTGRRSRRERAEQLLVTSTNNQAVDQVVEPLGRQMAVERLALALRVGNRAILAQRTSADLDAVIKWVTEAAKGADVDAQWRAASEAFDAAWEQLVERGGEPRDAAVQTRRIAELERSLAPIERDIQILSAAFLSAAGEEEEEDAAQRHDELMELREALGVLEGGLEELYEEVSSDTPPDAATCASRWLGIIEPARARAVELAEVAGGPVPALAEPDWSDMDEASEDLFRQHRGVVARQEPVDASLRITAPNAERRAALTECMRRRDAIRDELTPLVEARDERRWTPDDDAFREALVPVEHGLYMAALALREAWAAAHAPAIKRLCRGLKRSATGLQPWTTILERHDNERVWRALFPVVGSTLLSLANTLPLERGAVDLVVIDEAGQCPPAYVVPALYRANRAMIVGDVHQLEPVVMVTDREEAGVRRRQRIELPAELLAKVQMSAGGRTSAQSLAQLHAARVHRLVDHYRCQPEIAAISDALCDYGLRTHTPRRTLEGQARWLRAPVLFVPARGRQERRGGSLMNLPQADRVVRMVRYLVDVGLRPRDIGVLTPYRAQMSALATGLRAAGVPLEPWEMGGLPEAPTAPPGGGVVLGTVHRLQGGERDVVIFSTVVTDQASLRFIDDRPNLVNVAVSRARVHLAIFGDPEVLALGDYTGELVSAVTDVGWLRGS